MVRHNSNAKPANNGAAGSLREAHAGTAIAALTLGTILMLAHPNPMILPLLSGVLVSAGMALALFALVRHGKDVWQTERMLVPALLAFLGFAASIMSDPDRVVQSLSSIAQ